MRGFKFRYASLPNRLARLRSTAVPKPRGKVKQIRLWGSLFLSTKSFAPRQPIRFPLPKTSLISFLFFKCSSRLKRKEHSPPLMEALPLIEALPPMGALTSGKLIGLFLVRNSQFIPAFRPAAFQHQSPAPRFHSGAKPKFAISLNLAGLISPFHLFSP
jgi:hypothetical protein